MSSFSRRTFLGGIGATAALASSPFGRSRVRAQPAAPKLLIYATSTGPLVGPEGDSRLGYGGWLPRSLRDAGPDYAEVESGELPAIYAPLQRHSDEILFIDGLRGSDDVGAHQQPVCLLTGSGVKDNEEPRASGGDGEFHADTKSIDHLVAEAIGSRVLGMSYAIEGFNLGEGLISHTASGVPFVPIQSAQEAHDRVFGSVEASPTDTRAERQRSVLDVLRGEVTRVRATLPAADQATLAGHASALEAIRADISDPIVGCAPPTAPGSYDSRDVENFPRLMRDYNRTMVGALSCGYTRVGFIQYGNLGGSRFNPRWPELGLESTYNMHAISHKFEDQDGAGSDGLSQSDAIRLHLGTQEMTWTLFAELLDQLASTPDVDGSRLLDNTIVMQVCPMSWNHNRQRFIWMVAGGRNLGVRGGRFVRLPLNPSNRRQGRRYVNDLHVAVAHRMGVISVDRIGRNDQNQEPLDLG